MYRPVMQIVPSIQESLGSIPRNGENKAKCRKAARKGNYNYCMKDTLYTALHLSSIYFLKSEAGEDKSSSNSQHQVKTGPMRHLLKQTLQYSVTKFTKT